MAKKKKKKSKLLQWRDKRKPASIMKPSTFDKIEGTAKGKGGKKLSKESKKKIAGKAYWTTARAKHKKAKKRAAARKRNKQK